MPTQNSEALQKNPSAVQTSESPDVTFDAETQADLETVLARMAQDDAERAKLSGNWAFVSGGKTKITEIAQLGEGYQAKVVHTVAVTATEAELEQAKENGFIVLQGTEYGYAQTQEQLAALVGHDFPYEFEEGTCGVIVQHISGVDKIFNVYPVGDQYIFCKELGGVTTRLEEITDSCTVTLDGNMPLREGPSSQDAPTGGYTLASYLQNHSISSGSICRFEYNAQNEAGIYIDIR